ncbi:MAG TPA: BrnT family toxin [Thermoleophilia bacterium]|nr:BrnT family toxin [Thermoleophilia bacterium]
MPCLSLLIRLLRSSNSNCGAQGAEPRFVVIGLIGGRHWSAVVTYRGEVVRLISVRRSRAKEVATYEGQ